MPAPRYMRFFPDLYLDDTITLTMEEQGVYMRLLCLMWRHGGKIRNDDRVISRMLGIHVNKWAKVKPNVKGYLKEHSPGYLTQNRLHNEYRYSLGKSKLSNRDTDHDNGNDTHHNTPQDQAAKLIENNGHNFEPPPRDVDDLVGNLAKKFSGPLDQSKSKSQNYKYNRLEIDDAREKSCGKLLNPYEANSFVSALNRMFEAFDITMPSDFEIIRSWLENGIDPNRHIIPTVREILKRVETSAIDPPKSWRYFAKEVYQAANQSKGE